LAHWAGIATEITVLIIGPGQIRNACEMGFLGMLPSLTILDMCGNPLCSTDSYRQLAVSRLKRLKVRVCPP
jgi:hypothetical protein